MNKSKNKISSHPTGSNKREKILNSHGYDISKFTVLDIPVRRDSGTGRLVSTPKQSSKTLK